jgi:hypothetical protein
MKTGLFFRILSLVVAVNIPLIFAGFVKAEPVCTISRVISGPPLTVEFLISDTTSGLAAVTVVDSVNASIRIKSFPPGTFNPVNVFAERIDGDLDFRVVLEATAVNGQTTQCQFEEIVTGNAPSCSITAQSPGPPAIVEFTVQDTDDGLSSIEVIESTNASVSIPPFSAGTNTPIVVSASQIEPQEAFSIFIEALDLGNKATTCEYSQPAPPPPQDTTPPTCELTNIMVGPPVQLEFTVRDDESGLQAINEIDKVNATVSIPSFPEGTTDSVVLTATQVFSNLMLNVVFEAIDKEGNTTTCRYPDPLLNRTRPEFDTVGNDAAIFFRSILTDRIINAGRDSADNKINNFSNFSTEYFQSVGGTSVADPCFDLPGSSYNSVFSPSWTEASYEWEITLQMKPASDLFLTINSCALKPGENDVWTSAQQTGQFRLPWDPEQTVFAISSNPRITIQALPGPFAVVGFPEEGYYMDARRIPGMALSSVADSPISLQSFIEEGIMMSLPRQGFSNAFGQTMYTLNRGDRVRITIDIPFNNSADVFFGKDNMVLRYLGVVGTEYSTGN